MYTFNIDAYLQERFLEVNTLFMHEIPPVLMLDIPHNRLLQAYLKACSRLPAELCTNLRRIHCIP